MPKNCSKTSLPPPVLISWFIELNSLGAESEIRHIWGIRDTPLAERKELTFHEEQPFGNMNLVDVVKNIRRVENYSDVFYVIMVN